MSEQKERDRRRKNLIVFGAPVSSKETAEAQIADDKSFIESTFNAFKVDLKKIKSFRRFKQNPTSNRPPPILVQLENEHDRLAILKVSKDLRKIGKFSNVFINPDMTEAERVLDKKRREDRFNLNQLERSKGSNYRYMISGDGFRRFTIDPSPELGHAEMEP